MYKYSMSQMKLRWREVKQQLQQRQQQQQFHVGARRALVLVDHQKVRRSASVRSQSLDCCGSWSARRVSYR